jgi:hypothetical protein
MVCANGNVDLQLSEGDWEIAISRRAHQRMAARRNPRNPGPPKTLDEALAKIAALEARVATLEAQVAGGKAARRLRDNERRYKDELSASTSASKATAWFEPIQPLAQNEQRVGRRIHRGEMTSEDCLVFENQFGHELGVALKLKTVEAGEEVGDVRIGRPGQDEEGAARRANAAKEEAVGVGVHWAHGNRVEFRGVVAVHDFSTVDGLVRTFMMDQSFRKAFRQATGTRAAGEHGPRVVFEGCAVLVGGPPRVVVMLTMTGDGKRRNNGFIGNAPSRFEQLMDE